MGGVINFELNLDSLLNFAEKSLEEGDTLTCALNLNEAMSLAFTREEKKRVYALYIKCFRMTANVRSSLDVIALDTINRTESDYYRMDFSIKKGLIFESDDDMEEESPDYETARTYNEIRNLIAERKYDEAFALLSTVEFEPEYMESVVDALDEAVSLDKRLNLDKYLMPLMAIMASSPNQIPMLQVMLDGGKATHRVMVDSDEVLLEEEDSNILCLMGMAFFRSNEPEVAAKFFLKALEYDPIDEDALYYMTVIGKILQISEYGKYWVRYKQVYKITEPPVRLLEEFFDSEAKNFLVPYLSLPFEFAAEKARAILERFPEDGNVDDDLARDIKDYAKVSHEGPIMALLAVLDKYGKNPSVQNILVDLLRSGRVDDVAKERMLETLVNGGYEGDLCMVNENRVVFMRLAKLHRRVGKNWAFVYRYVLAHLPTVKPYIPINCSLLSSVIKRLDTELTLKNDDDLIFGVAIAMVNYLKKLRMNVDILSITRALNFNTDILGEGMKKFGLDTIYF